MWGYDKGSSGKDQSTGTVTKRKTIWGNRKPDSIFLVTINGNRRKSAVPASMNLDGTFTVDGVVHPTIGALERARGLPKNALRSRLSRGWDLERAVREPIDAARSGTTRSSLAKAGRTRSRRSNAAGAADIPESITAEAIREHLARPRNAFGDPRLWWVNLGMLYGALRAQSFATPSGKTRPGFHDWLRAHGLMPFAAATANAAMRMARNVDAIQRSPAWRAGKVHPTDLVRDLAPSRVR
jgi:hypothetical protein